MKSGASRFRGTLIAVVLVGILVALTLYDRQRSTKQEEQAEQAKSVVRMSADEIGTIDLIKPNGEIKLEKKNDKWRLTVPVDDAADPQAMATLISSLEGEKIMETVIEGPNIDLKPYGLVDAGTRLKLVSTDGKKQEEIRIGTVKAYDSNLYAMIDQEPKVLLLGSAWDPMLAKLPKDLRDKHFVRQDLRLADVKKITIHRSGADFELIRDGEHWKAGRGMEAYPILDDKVAFLYDEIKALRGAEFLEGDRAKYGLAKPAAEVKLFTDKAEPTEALAFAAGTLPAGPKKNAVPLTAGVGTDLKDVLSVSRTAADGVTKSPQEFYDRKRPFEFNATDVGRIEITSPELKGAFLKKGDVWVSADPGLQKPIDSAKLNDAIAKLGKMEAVRILSPAVGQRLKTNAKLVLANAKGEPLWTLDWSTTPITDKSGGVEASVLPARTSKVPLAIGVTEGEIKGLGFAKWFAQPATATPTPAPATKPEPKASPPHAM